MRKIIGICGIILCTISCSAVNEIDSTEEFVPENVSLNVGCTNTKLFVSTNDYFAVSCYKASKDIEIISNFRYYLFNGYYENFNCGALNHNFIYFITNDNEKHIIPNDVDILTYSIVSNSAIWTNNQINGFVGKFGEFIIHFDQDIKVEKEQLLCLGFNLSSMNDEMNCPFICETDELLYRHQISISDEEPYLFQQANFAFVNTINVIKE